MGCSLKFTYNLFNHSRWFRIPKNREAAIGRLAENFSAITNLFHLSTELSVEWKVIAKRLFGIQEMEEERRIEISFERVSFWTLVFTNAFFVSYFFAKLFHWI